MYTYIPNIYVLYNVPVDLFNLFSYHDDHDDNHELYILKYVYFLKYLKYCFEYYLLLTHIKMLNLFIIELRSSHTLYSYNIVIF